MKINGKLKIGWAQRDITPRQPVLLDGQVHARVSQNVIDPLTATALALENGRGRAILVSCDMVGIYAQTLAEIKAAVAERIPGFDPRHLIVNATHTHTAPVQLDGKYAVPAGESLSPAADYRAFLVGQVAAVAGAAWEARAPGGVSRAYGHAVVGHNRRARFFDGQSIMYANPDRPDFDSLEGYEDHGVDLLFTWDEKRQLTGLIANLACPSQVTEGLCQVSADFWHETRQAIRQRCGEKLFILPQCAPAGDQSPHFLLHKGLEAMMRERRGLSEREEIARRLANTVDEILTSARGEIDFGASLEHLTETLELPRRLVTVEERDQAQSEIDRLEADPNLQPTARFWSLRRNRRILERFADQTAQPTRPVELHVMRLGEIALATNPFELFLDYGLRIKARSAASQTFLVQIACGYDGYLPTEKALQACLPAVKDRKLAAMDNYGAGVASNEIGPAGGQVLVERTVELIAGLFAPGQAG